jgi:hypothetical protein
VSRASQLALGRAVAALLLALPLSCSDLPTRPLRLVPVTGTIQDRDGAPLEFFRIVFVSTELRSIRMESPPDPHMVGTTLSGADGGYSLDLYEGDYDVSLYPVVGSGYADWIHTSGKIDPERARFDYRYAGVRVLGRVDGPGGSPIPGADAFAHRVDNYLQRYFALDRGPGFSMLVEPGRYDITIYPLGTDGVPARTLPGVEVRADTTVEFHLDGFPITGTVHGPDGGPLPGVSVQAYGSTASCSSLTGADGAYRMYLPQGVYSWTVMPEGSLSYIAYRKFPSTSITGPAQFDFDLDGITWSGRVRVLPDSAPGRGYQVVAYPESYGSVGSAYTTTDSAGAFRLVVPTGRLYALEVQSPGPPYQRWGLPPIRAGVDSTLDLLLDPAAARTASAPLAVAITPDRPAAPRPGDRVRPPRLPAAR